MPAGNRSSRTSEANSYGISGGGPLVRGTAPSSSARYEAVAPAERGHAQPGRPTGRVARRRPVERLRPDSQSRHRAAVRRQPASPVNPTSAKILESFYRAPEPVHGRRHQRAELRRQRAWRLHRQRVRRPLPTRCSSRQPEGLRPADVEERGRQEPGRAATGTRPRATTSSAPRFGRSPRRTQLGARRLRQRGPRRLVEHGGEGQLLPTRRRAPAWWQRRPGRARRRRQLTRRLPALRVRATGRSSRPAA